MAKCLDDSEIKSIPELAERTLQQQDNN